MELAQKDVVVNRIKSLGLLSKAKTYFTIIVQPRIKLRTSQCCPRISSRVSGQLINSMANSFVGTRSDSHVSSVDSKELGRYEGVE